MGIVHRKTVMSEFSIMNNDGLLDWLFGAYQYFEPYAIAI